jgi:hypothetical protein
MHYDRYIDQLTEDKYALERALQNHARLMETLHEENMALTRQYNTQGQQVCGGGGVHPYPDPSPVAPDTSLNTSNGHSLSLSLRSYGFRPTWNPHAFL